MHKVLEMTALGCTRSYFFMVLVALLGSAAYAQTPVTGLWDESFGPLAFGGNEVNSFINALARHPVTGEIYAGGAFSRAGGLPDAIRIARWTSSGWAALGGGLSGPVEDIAFDSIGNLYVAGNFVEARQSDGTSIVVNDVARWDGSQWHALGYGLSGNTHQVEVDPATDAVYFGGIGFDEGINADSSLVVSPKIIRWTGTNWEPVGKGLKPGFGTGVFALAIDPANGDLYAGGALLGDVFNLDSTAVASYGLARWDGTQWSSLRSQGDSRDVSVLTFDPSGRLWAGGNFSVIGGVTATGLAYWDGTTWVVDRGGRTDGGIEAMAFVNGEMYIGGSFTEVVHNDGSVVTRFHIARWNGSRWQPLGSGMWAPNFPGVYSLVADGSDLYVGGRFRQAGGVPSLRFGRWMAEPPPYAASYATFGVDLRRAQRLKVPESNTQPFVNIYTGDRSGRYFLYDPDGDSVWTGRVAQPVGVPLRYLFGLDLNRDGFDGPSHSVDHDWILELTGSESGSRQATIASAAAMSLPVAAFDNLPLEAFRTDFNAFQNAPREAGNPDPIIQRLFSGQPFNVTTDFESLDRTVQLADNVFNGVEASPFIAEYSARVSFSYENVTGIEIPADIRVLYRPTPSDPWTIRTTELDATGQTFSVAGIIQLNGEWTFGSVSSDNPLSADPPELVSVPSPVDGALGVPISPTLSWAPPRHASSYALYLWPTAETEPTLPVAGSFREPSFSIRASGALTQGVEYSWRVVARNANGETRGPVWSFVAGAAADLLVADVQPPTDAVAGNEISVTWTVENAGSAGTRSQGWTDAIFFSQDDSLDIREDILVGLSTNPSYLGPNDRYTQTLDFELPQRVRSLNQEIVVEGNYTVFVVADYVRNGTSGSELESNETNNSTPANLSTSVQQPILPDLRVTGLLEPETYCPQLLCVSGGGCTVLYSACEVPNPFAWDLFGGLFGVRYVFSWEGINEGMGSAREGFQSFLFFQKDSVLNAAKAIPIGMASVASVGAGSTYTMTTDRLRKIDLQAAATLSGQILPDSGYFFVATDFGNSVFEGIDEVDNVYRNPERTVFRSVPPSDLEMTSVTAAGSARSGDSLDVEWNVRNNGPSEVIPTYWFDAVYLSEDDTFDPEADVFLKRFPFSSSIANPISADATLNRSEKVRLPDGVEGDFYLFVLTDDDDRVNEVVNGRANRDNNLRRSAPLSIELASYPDLQVTDLVLPTSVTRGTAARLEYEVTNFGGGSTARDNTWRDRVYLSTGETLSESARSVAVVRQDDVVLDSGASRRRSITVRFPKGLVAGQYYVFVVADADSLVFEHGGESNNIRRSEPIMIETGPTPDLVLENIEIPASASSGTDVTIGWRVRNAGTSTTDATSWADGIFLSTDSDLDLVQDQRLVEVVRAEALAPGAFYDVSHTVSLPEDVSGGRHFIVQTDLRQRVADLNRGNNTGTSASPTTIALSPFADLVVESVGLAGTPRAGQPISLSMTVRNAGADVAAGQTWTDSWAFGSSSSTQSSTEVLHSETVRGPLASGATYVDNVEITLPTYASGGFYLTSIANADGGLGEGGQTANNTDRQVIDVVLPPPVDLVVQNISIPAGAQPGEFVTISYDVVNQGINSVDGVMYDAVYLSIDETFDATDPRLGVERREVNLAAGARTQVLLTVELPRFSGAGAHFSAKSAADELSEEIPGLVPGEYRAIVWTDVRNNIRETENDNNRATSAGALAIDVPEIFLDTAAAGTVGSRERVYYKIDVAEGRDLRLSLTNASGDVRDAAYEVYVAFDRSPTPDDFDHAFLAESQDKAPQVLVPATEAGTYYILVRNPFLLTEQVGSFSLLAEAFDFTLFSISPDAGGSGGRVVATIQGAQLGEDTSFYLTDGVSRVDGTLLRVLSPMEVEVRFDLQGEPVGTYDVLAEQTGGSSAQLQDAFAVETLVTDNLQFAISMPPTLFRNAGATFRLIVENKNNIDLDVVVVSVILPGDHAFRIESMDFTGAPLPVDYPEDAPLPLAGVPVKVDVPDLGLDFAPTEWGMLVLYGKSLRVGESLSADIIVDRVNEEVGEPFPMLVSASGQSDVQFIQAVVDAIVDAQATLADVGPEDFTVDAFGTSVQQIRSLLDAAGAVPAGELVGMVEAYYRAIGLLGENEISGLTARLVYDPDDLSYLRWSDSIGKQLVQLSSLGGRICGATGTFIELSVAGIALVAAGVALWKPGAALATILPSINGTVLAAVEWAAFTGAIVAYGDALWTGVRAIPSGIYSPGQGPGSDTVGRIPAPPLTKLICEPIFGSVDPNDIVGPSGFGDARWVRRDETLGYTIRFENDPELANAPARSVVIHQPLDPDFDLRTFRLKRFGFGSFDFEVPGNRAYYSTRLDLTDSLGIYVDVDAGLDIGARAAFVRFNSIDPSTGEPSQQSALGFLPPNLTSPEGEGFVGYTIQALPDVPTGTRLDAQAQIVFDNNAPIDTPPIFNTVDADPPTTALLPSFATELDTASVQLSWTGTRSDLGSGTQSFTLYAGVEGESLEPVARGLTDTTYVFGGSAGVRYEFFVVGRDHTGNVEPLKNAELVVALAGEDDVDSELPREFALHQNFPNPFNPTTTIPFDLPENGDVEITLFDVLGRRVMTVDRGSLAAGRYQQIVDLSRFASGVYLYQIRVVGDRTVRFRDVGKLVLVK
jgi:hypothetical protein